MDFEGVRGCRSGISGITHRYLHLSESDHPGLLLWLTETVFSMERFKAAKLGICWCFREAGRERPVLLGVHIIVLSMAGPTNGTVIQRVGRRASRKWEYTERDANQAMDSLGAPPSSSHTFKPDYTVLGNR